MSERLECEVLQRARYINTLTFTFTLYHSSKLLSFEEIAFLYFGVKIQDGGYPPS